MKRREVLALVAYAIVYSLVVLVVFGKVMVSG